MNSLARAIAYHDEVEEITQWLMDRGHLVEMLQAARSVASTGAVVESFATMAGEYCDAYDSYAGEFAPDVAKKLAVKKFHEDYKRRMAEATSARVRAEAADARRTTG